ncbi:unnamed protein product, partial [Ceratitis capitata]
KITRMPTYVALSFVVFPWPEHAVAFHLLVIFSFVHSFDFRLVINFRCEWEEAEKFWPATPVGNGLPDE